MKIRDIFIVTLSLAAIIFASLTICGVFKNPTHYDIVIRPGIMRVHTDSYEIHDGYVCTPTQCIPEKRVLKIEVIKDCRKCLR